MNGGDSYYSTKSVLALINASTLNSDIVYGQSNYVYSDKYSKIISPSTFVDEKFAMPFCHQSCIVRLGLHKKTPYNIEYKIGADYDFFYNLYFKKVNFIRIKEVIANFELGGISSQITSLHRKERKEIFLKYNNTIKFRIELFVWEQIRLVKYCVKKLPFSLYLIKIKHAIENRIEK
jgi:hypothetical protein